MSRSYWLILALTVLSVPAVAVVAHRLYLLTVDALDQHAAARVNESVITREELQAQVSLADQMLRLRKEMLGWDLELDPTGDTGFILMDLIDRRLLSQDGRMWGVEVGEQFADRMRELERAEGVQSEAQLKKNMTAKGIDFDLLKTDLYGLLVGQAVIDEIVRELIVVSEEDEKEYYRKFASKFEQGEAVHLFEILVSASLNRPVDSGDLADSSANGAQEKARKLLWAIRHGGSFEQIARRESNGSTSSSGGDLGWYSRGSLDKRLEDVAFSLKVGAVSDVIPTKQGYVILKVVEHRQDPIPPLSEVRSEVRDAIHDELVGKVGRKYLFWLRSQSFLMLKPGYIDKGALEGEETLDPVRTLKEAAAWLLPGLLILGFSLWTLRKPDSPDVGSGR
jgi:peptidyl-prolyl cis-trans isomerase SurA